VTRRLALAWGVVPVLAEVGDDIASTGARISDQLVSSHALERGSVIVFVSVSTDLGPGPTNFVKLQRI
jgi:pyruvate kinase